MRSPTQSTVWRDIASDKASKSNIGTRCLLRRSAEPVGAIEESLHVKCDRVFKPREAAVVTGAAQPIDLALGEILVAAADLFGHVDILDVRRRAERAKGSQHHVLEAAGLAGPDIEQAADARRRQEPGHDADDVVDIDKITALIAIGDTL